MATEVYEMLMKIGLKNEALEGLKALGEMLTNLQGMLSKLEGNLQGVAQGMVGAGFVMGTAGLAMGAGLSTLGTHAAEATKEFNILKNMIGDTGAEQLKLAAWNATHAVPGTEYIENLKLASKMAGLGMEPEQITALLPELAKTAEFLEVGGRDKTAFADIGGLMQVLGRTGMTDPGQRDKLLAYIDGMVKAVQASGGEITAQDYMKAIRFGGIESMGWSDEFVRNVLPKLILDFKSGGAAGGGGMAAMQGNIGMLMSQAFKTALQDELGGKGRGAAAWKKYGLPEVSEQMLTNPFLAAQAIGPKLMEAAGGDQTKLFKELGEIFSPKVAAVMADMILRAKEFEAYAARTGAIGTTKEDLERLQAGDPFHQIKEFRAAFKNLGDAIGEPLERIKLAATSPMVGLLNSLSILVTSTNPETMDMIAKALWGIAAGMTALGAAAVVGGAMLLAPGGAITLAIIGLGTAIGTLTAINWEPLKKEFQWWADFFKSLSTWAGSKKFWPQGPLDEGGAPLKQPGVFHPGTDKQVLQPINMSLNIDGRMLAQAMSTAMEDLYNHPNGAAAPNGWDNFRSVDSNTTST